SGRGWLFSSLSRNFWIPLLVLLTAAQMAVVFSLGTRRPGPALVGFGDLLFNLLCLALVVRAARKSVHLARYFWYVAAFSFSFFCVAVICNLYVQVVQPLQSVADVADIISVFWFCPVSLTLFLEPDFEIRRFDPIHILDFIQVVLLWVVIYFFFLYMPNHESSGSPFHRTWILATWVGSLMYDGAMASVFLLRAAFTNSRVVRTLFGRFGVFLIFACLGDFYYNYLGGTLQTGSWYEAIWTVLNIIPIVIVGTWDPEKIENTNVRPFFNELIGNRLFPILFGFLVLVLSLYIAQERTLFALVIVAISFFCSSLRLVIAQQRQDRIQLDLQTEILRRESVEQQLRRNEEHLEELVAERTVKLEESRQQLRQAQKMEAIGRLAGGIAHDFNNLLTVIRGYSKLLLDRAAGHEFRGGLARIDDAADRAASLTKTSFASSNRFSPQKNSARAQVSASRWSTASSNRAAATFGCTASPAAAHPSKSIFRWPADPPIRSRTIRHPYRAIAASRRFSWRKTTNRFANWPAKHSLPRAIRCSPRKRRKPPFLSAAIIPRASICFSPTW